VEERDVVDHALARRALLREVLSGRATDRDVCDASPFLKRAAKELGGVTDRRCPICRRAPLWEALWVYGDAIGDASGSSRTARQVERLAREHPDFAVYVVEVCQDCGWNHLVRSFWTGTPGTAPARRTRRREA
jgi:hypothetical protein